MTEDVLSQGSDRPPRRLGPLGVGLGALALLAVGVYGAVRDDAKPEARPTPAPSVSTGFTELPPPDDTVTIEDPFSEYETFALPREGTATLVRSDRDGMPLFLTVYDGQTLAVEPFGGEPSAPVLVGWCARTRTFQNPTGTLRYWPDGFPAQGNTVLGTRQARVDPGDPTKMQVTIGERAGQGYSLDPPRPRPRCAARELTMPAVPRGGSLTDASHGMVRLHGRYVASVETRAFCVTTANARCMDSGWEEFGPLSVLPPGDLAESYTYEGDFLVHTDSTTGSLVVVRVDTRLTKVEGKGVRAVRGIPRGTTVRGGVTRLTMQPSENDRAHVVDYVVRSDVHAFLGDGVTGLGRPPGTRDVLVRWVGGGQDTAVWLVLDAKDRVMRVVREF